MNFLKLSTYRGYVHMGHVNELLRMQVIRCICCSSSVYINLSIFFSFRIFLWLSGGTSVILGVGLTSGVFNHVLKCRYFFLSHRSQNHTCQLLSRPSILVFFFTLFHLLTFVFLLLSPAALFWQHLLPFLPPDQWWRSLVSYVEEPLSGGAKRRSQKEVLTCLT